MTNHKRSERIFLTAKTRMVAEARARSLNSFLNILTAWYSFCLIAVSVANLSGILRHGTIEFSATLMSIALFGVSLFLLGGRLEQRAEEYRKCYLALKAIYHSSNTEDEKMLEYEQEIAKYPNHAPIDYDLMIFETHSRGQKLWNEEGEIKQTSQIEKRAKRQNLKAFVGRLLAIILPGILFCTSYMLSVPFADTAEGKSELEADVDGD